jgi:TOMM system kinase/cyclase fusion protein
MTEPATATLANGSLFEDRYEILGELGSGSFGRVYEARQLSTGQSVAIKLLSAREGTEESTGREADRFRRETQICAALSHAFIVQLIDSGETGAGQLYAVFAHVPGETLEQALARDGALPVRECVRLMTQVLDALACAHAQGIVHRDLKPANLMLSGTGSRRNALVLDFGLGGLAEGRRRKQWQTLTQSREFLGTPLYAAPEQLVGETPTPRADLYAWGLIFLECLTGRHPFEEAGAAARLLTGGGAVEIPEWLRGHRLGELLATVTAREPEKRDVSLEALIEALDQIAGGGELPVAPVESKAPPPLTEHGERRHLTVMFCDLVGSVALSQQLAAEAYRGIVQAYQARCTGAIERYGGHVAQYLGDALLVYFGYPQAHEDDAERAVRAGREVLRELQLLNPRIEVEHGVRIAARLGIHTGPAVIGDMGGGEKEETLALGDTPNVAARLQEVAEPDTVVISDATLRLVAGLFITEDGGTPPLKGISEPIRVHRVLQPSGVTSRLDRAPALTPFVGREQELGLLLDRFEQARESQGQAVLIAGEAGIGKSRLVHRLRERLRETPHTWLECRSSLYTEKSAFYPVIELLEGPLGFSDAETSEQKLGLLERGLAHVGLEPTEAVPLFAGLLSLRLPERYAPLEISPQLQRQKTLEALLAWLLALGEKQPLVLVVEDLHWTDPSTLEWLGLLIEQCPTAGVLLLLTFRPEFEPPWPSRAHLVPITLSRLSRRQAKELVTAAISGEAPSDALVDRIAARSDGVPLFAEELTKGVVELGHDLAGSLSGLEIPETLQDSLMARLDRLGEAKHVAQLGAALGREFPYALLESVAPVKEIELRAGLGRLVEAELLYQRGLPPKATYTFKHALMQDTAYQSLLESQRKELHGRIANALETRFPERVAREPEVIGHHCSQAGHTARAIGHYQRAGERATQRFAHAEAAGLLRRATELLRMLPETPERNHQELQLQLALGGALMPARGFIALEVERAYERARELCAEIGQTPELFQAFIGLSLFYYHRGELRTSTDLAERALALAERAGEGPLLLAAHTRLGINLYTMGEPTRALDHFEQAIRVHDPEEHRSLLYARGQDWGVIARAFGANVLRSLGYPDRARRMGLQAIEMARAGDPIVLAIALTQAAADHYWLGEHERALERADEAIAIARKRGLPFAAMMAGIIRAPALGGVRGREELEVLMAQLEASGARFQQAYALLYLVRAEFELGRMEEARAALEGAFDGVLGAWASELHRLKGAILLRRDAHAHAEEAERSLRRALEVAREQEARSDELRAATSLARLLRDRGRSDEARALLQPVYDWFTEGFDTADLKDAKALLEELA